MHKKAVFLRHFVRLRCRRCDEMKRCVIVGGADIKNYEQIRQKLCPDDYFIYCDGGLKHKNKLGFEPQLIIGDFDSYENPHLNVETIVLPCEKNDTDTFFAAKEAVKRGFDEFLLIGTVGGRLDHTIGNISILLYLFDAGKKAEMIDDYSEMQIVSNETAFVDSAYEFFSLLNISGEAEGITVKNAKYPLQNAQITCEYQYGISNEPLPEKISEITVEKGKMLLVKVR